ncbi:hypothetical protein [Massilibacteroides sp.]|uniref:TolB family protein n=1 Tax=Massilibacteroides sp. TaxID=2034766 RepID=UPI0026333EF0|nr:hypothetical protein [Massilibacteroides sp.]MDD4515766.1 hypothetical protein [Massilibacteroides sp.]
MKNLCFCFFLIISFLSCSGNFNITEHSETYPELFPDYINTTIPPNIAPLNFSLQEKNDDALVKFEHKDFTFQIYSTDGTFDIPLKKWKRLLQVASGNEFSVTVCVKTDKGGKEYAPFKINVAREPIDSYIAYRLIDPGYSLWNEMGIYQRELSSFKETVLYENKLTQNNCVNCHSFCQQDPSQMLFHMRGNHAGTILIQEGEIKIIQPDAKKNIPSLVYPYWHPSGQFIAFSTNKTTQDFHPTQRVEVFDHSSDVFVYDIKRNERLSTPFLDSKNNMETFPSFSPDGKTLYFCTAQAQPVPDSINRLKYNLCSVSFDINSRSFGNQIDTLFNAEKENKSISFPRVSPDGKYLLCTVSGYGTFPIWHKDADLYLVDMNTKQGRFLKTFNSNDTESYHSWSSNSRWVIFSSRRIDGLYTRPFIAYLSEDGMEGKPFLLPQKDPSYYTLLMKSFNIPEFCTDKVTFSQVDIMQKVKEETDTKFIGENSVN